MSIPLEAIVGELHIIDGARQPIAAPTATFQPSRRAARGRAGDRLFVLLELRPPDASARIEVYNAPYNKILDQVEAAYWRTSGSVTAALREAITAANNWLMDYNLETPVDGRFSAGITCVTMRESDVYIAQAGPAACYVAHQGSLERFPSRNVTAPPLGASRGCEVRYSHAELHPGDVVLMCDSLTAERVPDETIASAIVYVGVPAALTNLERLAGDGDLIALIIESAAAGGTVHAEASPRLTDSRPLPPTVAPELSEPDVIPEIARPHDRGPSWRERLAGLWGRLRRPGRPARQTGRPDQAGQERAREIVRSLLIGIVAAARNAQALFRRMLPEAPAARSTPKPGNTMVMAGLTILIPLALTFLFVSAYVQRRQQAEFETLMNLARAEIQHAQTALDEPAQRQHWRLAVQHLESALNYQPHHNQASQTLYTQTRNQLDRLCRVARVNTALLFDFGQGADYRMTVQSVNVFVVNSKYLWHLTLNETGTGLLGNQLPAAYSGATISGRPIGTLLDLAWAGAQGARARNSLLVLDSGGLLEYDPAWNVRTIALGQGEMRPGARLMSAFGGNLYVLDNNQLWRYKPFGDGFGAAPEAYFNAPPGDLSTVLDLAIDGSVYLLYADGRIRKFFGGEEQVFTPTDLPEPPVRPVALAVDAETMRGSVYVADPGAGSVMQFTPNGIFIRQYKPADNVSMSALQSVYVDERAQRLYFLSGGKLYAAALPPVQTP